MTPLAEASAQAASPPRTLWAAAPAWRTLVITATLLTAAAVALPLALGPVGRATPAGAPAPSPAPAPAPAPTLAEAGPGPASAAGGAGHAGTEDTPSVQACALTLPAASTEFTAGSVVGFEPPAISLARIKTTEREWGGLIDPDYIDNPRVAVRLRDGAVQVFLEPKSIPVHVGDRVTVQNAFRNLNLPCDYVPPLITADLGPAPRSP